MNDPGALLGPCWAKGSPTRWGLDTAHSFQDSHSCCSGVGGGSSRPQFPSVGQAGLTGRPGQERQSLAVLELRSDTWPCVDFGILGSPVSPNASARSSRAPRWSHRDTRAKCDSRITPKAPRCVCPCVGVCTWVYSRRRGAHVCRRVHVYAHACSHAGLYRFVVQVRARV